MMTNSIYGLSLCPAALADEKGNVVVVPTAASGDWLEALLRLVISDFRNLHLHDRRYFPDFLEYLCSISMMWLS